MCSYTQTCPMMRCAQTAHQASRRPPALLCGSPPAQKRSAGTWDVLQAWTQHPQDLSLWPTTVANGQSHVTLYQYRASFPCATPSPYSTHTAQHKPHLQPQASNADNNNTACMAAVYICRSAKPTHPQSQPCTPMPCLGGMQRARAHPTPNSDNPMRRPGCPGRQNKPPWHRPAKPLLHKNTALVQRCMCNATSQPTLSLNSIMHCCWQAASTRMGTAP